MKITGYALREAIKQWELRKDAAERIFKDSLHVFAGETKESPLSVIEGYTQAELAIAALQEAQAKYNLSVELQFEGKPVTLSWAVKSIGGFARIEKLWRTTAGEKKSSYYNDGTERDSTKVYAKAQVTPADAVKASMAMARRTSTLRALIAAGNGQEREVELDKKFVE